MVTKQEKVGVHFLSVGTSVNPFSHAHTLLSVKVQFYNLLVLKRTIEVPARWEVFQKRENATIRFSLSSFVDKNT